MPVTAPTAGPSPAVLAEVGSVVSSTTARVTRQEFQRWAAAVDDRNPLYFDAEFARRHGHRDVVMPPLFIKEVLRGVVDLRQLGPDGVPRPEGLDYLAHPGYPRKMAGAESMTFTDEAVYDGDEVRAVRTLTAVELKQGRSGSFIRIALETVFSRDGVELARVVHTFLCLPEAT